MAWTAISSTQTDAGSPLDQTLMDAIRNDLNDLNTRLSAIGVASDQNIYDDFTADRLSILGTNAFNGVEADGDDHTWQLGGTVPVLSANPDHYLNLIQAGGANYSAIAASVYKMRFDLSRDHTVVYEVRHKSQTSDNTEVWAFGFQDATLATTAATIATTQADFLGFVQGATANTYKAITSSTAAGGTTTVATNQGNAANWTILKVAVTFSGATQQVEFFIDGTSIGVSTTKITLLRLRPIAATSGGGGARNQSLDYLNAYWASRPLNS